MEIKTNYEKMTDQELDKLAAEMCGLTLGGSLFFKHGELYDWNPTHPDSNQAERYLYEKLLKSGCYPSMAYNADFTHDNVIWSTKTETLCKIRVDQKQINRTKVIACLEAWEKLK